MDVAEFTADVGVETLWYVPRFYPAYEFIDLPPTPIETERKARNIGLKAGLRYVYSGNVSGPEKILVARTVEKW